MATKKAVARTATAIPKLPTNFQDDILNTEVSDKRIYQVTEVSEGVIALEDVSTYVQVGSDFGSEQINATNTTVNDLIDKTANIEDGTTVVKNAETADTATVAESVENDFILVNQQVLTFTNKICSIQDSRITANSLADVYFTADSINVAENAVISVETYNGEVELTAGREPEGTIRASIHIRVV